MFHILGVLNNVVEGMDCFSRQPGFGSWLYHLLGCVTLGKLFNLSEPWCSHL